MTSLGKVVPSYDENHLVIREKPHEKINISYALIPNSASVVFDDKTLKISIGYPVYEKGQKKSFDQNDISVQKGVYTGKILFVIVRNFSVEKTDFYKSEFKKIKVRLAEKAFHKSIKNNYEIINDVFSHILINLAKDKEQKATLS